jgi:hypothetical protein
MAKWYGSVGYAEMVETRPGVYQEQITERNYYGDLVRNARNLRVSDGVNDDVDISNQFSIVADLFANQNFHQMRYVTYMGTKWKITNVEVRYPRLILTAGGVYNGA